ncbi:hypothetical protein CRG98_041006 [Punica granatum]|uniref:Uncharacterized protein n=1 Tax=Punica granatum TaxID=22663 RepID=A0A2I0I407_PUNGR|nr:hypothetical protein CRG98_041006 [Punica granatum]
MVRCARCCLRKAMGVMNIVVTLCGIGMIIYSLWLQKMWEIGVSDLPSIANLPKPCQKLNLIVSTTFSMSNFIVATWN